MADDRDAEVAERQVPGISGRGLDGRGVRRALPLMLVLLAAACARPSLRQAETWRAGHDYDKALARYLKALRERPQDIQLKLAVDGLLKEAAAWYGARAAQLEQEGHAALALQLYRKALEYDPGDRRTRQRLQELQRPGEGVETIESQAHGAELAVSVPPSLASPERIDVDFRHKTGLLAILRVLAQSGGVNLLFDPDLADKPVAVTLRQVTLREALDRICQISESRYFVLDGRNILVAPDTESARSRYQELVVKNIYFSNVEADEAKRIMEQAARLQRLIVNKPSNSLIVADSAENVVLAERLARFIDKRKGEVEIDVEIMEVDRKRLKQYGTELSSWSVGAALSGSGGGLSADALRAVDLSADVLLSVPQAVWRFMATVTDSKILAQPKVRGMDKERVEIQLGEKRPIPTTTFVPLSQGSLNQQPITSYSMTDVGITLNITPTIHLNEEVTLELVFSLTYVIDIGSATLPPTLGNRRVTTRLRLRTGETGIIAGLMRGSTTTSRTGVPLLNDIPLLRDLFSSNRREHERTDILLSITPRILRMPEITRGDLEPHFIGTEARPGLQRAREAPPAPPPPAPAPVKKGKPGRKKANPDAAQAAPPG